MILRSNANYRIDNSIGNSAVAVETDALKFTSTQGEVVLMTLVLLPRVEVRFYLSESYTNIVMLICCNCYLFLINVFVGCAVQHRLHLPKTRSF